METFSKRVPNRVIETRDVSFDTETGELTSGMRPPNDVTLGEINDAIEYFYEQGFLEELTSDKRHYVEILLKLAAHYKGI